MEKNSTSVCTVIEQVIPFVPAAVLPLPSPKKGRLTGSANAWKKFGTIGYDAYTAFLNGAAVDVELEVIPVYA